MAAVEIVIMTLDAKSTDQIGVPCTTFLGEVHAGSDTDSREIPIRISDEIPIQIGLIKFNISEKFLFRRLPTPIP